MQAWSTGSFVFIGILYLLEAVFVFMRQQSKARDFGLLLAILIVLGFTSLFQAASLSAVYWSGVLFYGLLVVSILLLHQFRVSLSVSSRASGIFWWITGSIWLLASVIMMFVQPQLAGWVQLAGWIVFTGASSLFVIRVIRKTILPFSQRQMLYWASVLFLFAVADILAYAKLPEFANVFAFVGAALLVYVITASQMVDFLSLMRRVLTTLIIGLGVIGVYALIWSGVSAVSDLRPTSQIWLPGLVLLILVVVFFQTLWKSVERVVLRIVPGTDFDTNRIIREYSLSISNILDPQRLASVAVGLISEAIEVQRGILLLVFREQMGETNGYRLKGNAGMGISAPEDGFLDTNSLIVERFTQGREMLTQYDLDFAPDFAELPPNERQWLTALGVDIYIPIYAKDDWIGLLALGAKASGQPYGEDDKLLLRILADQTAVALQNARLVDSLMRVNNDFRRAYSAMDQSNRQLARANTQLEKLDRAKSDFIAIASHELRTPLTVMRGYTEMLQDDPTIKDNSYYQKLVSGIHNGIMRFHEIVDGMLDIAMIDNSTLNLSVNDVSLDVLLRIISTSIKDAAAERHIEVSLQNLQDLPPIQGDPEALRKVFYHLLVNAIKYTPDGGSVSITGRKLSAGEQSLSSEGVEIVVSDTGIGIAPEYHDLIFVKFYQTGEIALHSSGKTKFKGGGPGLGLTIARGIIEAHGGRIWVESPGHDEEKCPGSKFYVALPIRNKGL